jgi:hypothetical protein
VATVLAVGFASLLRGVRQRLVLGGVEEASRRVAVLFLPARDGRARRFVERPIDLRVEPEPGQPTLHVAALCLGEADLSLCLLGRFVGRDCRIGGRQRFAGRAAQTSLGKVRAVDDRQDGECQDQGVHGPSFALTSADDTV